MFKPTIRFSTANQPELSPDALVTINKPSIWVWWEEDQCDHIIPKKQWIYRLLFGFADYQVQRTIKGLSLSQLDELIQILNSEVETSELPVELKPEFEIKWAKSRDLWCYQLSRKDRVLDHFAIASSGPDGVTHFGIDQLQILIGGGDEEGVLALRESAHETLSGRGDNLDRREHAKPGLLCYENKVFYLLHPEVTLEFDPSVPEWGTSLISSEPFASACGADVLAGSQDEEHESNSLDKPPQAIDDLGSSPRPSDDRGFGDAGIESSQAEFHAITESSLVVDAVDEVKSKNLISRCITGLRQLGRLGVISAVLGALALVLAVIVVVMVVSVSGLTLVRVEYIDSLRKENSKLKQEWRSVHSSMRALEARMRSEEESKEALNVKLRDLRATRGVHPPTYGVLAPNWHV